MNYEQVRYFLSHKLRHPLTQILGLVNGLIDEQKEKNRGRGKVDWRLTKIKENCELMLAWMSEIATTLDHRQEGREKQLSELEAKIIEKFTELLAMVSQMKSYNNSPELFSSGREDKKEEK